MRQNYHHRSGNLTALLKRCPARSDEWNRAIKLGIHNDDDDEEEGDEDDEDDVDDDDGGKGKLDCDDGGKHFDLDLDNDDESGPKPHRRTETSCKHLSPL